MILQWAVNSLSSHGPGLQSINVKRGQDFILPQMPQTVINNNVKN